MLSNVGMDQPPPHEECTNCGLIMVNSGFCRRCVTLPQCPVCKRRLPSNAFDAVPGNCQACDRKNRKKLQKTRHAIDNIVAEVNLPTDDTDTTYERFITRNALDILEVMDEHIKMKK